MHIITLKDGEFPILAFDTETTGIDALTDHIITWGSSSQEDDEREEILQLPESVTELDAANVAVHGYDVDTIAKIGKERQDGLLEAFTLLDDFNTSTDGFILGHNIVYDMTILHAELMRENFTSEAEQMSSWRVLDTLPILEDSTLIGMFKTSLKLNFIAETLDVDHEILDNAHNAGADSKVAAALLEKIMLYFPHLSTYTAKEFMEYMRECAQRSQNRKLAIFEDSPMVGYPVLMPIEKKSAQTMQSKKKPDVKKRKAVVKSSRKSTSRAVRKTSTTSSSRLRKGL